jgi:hypothetical protein
MERIEPEWPREAVRAAGVFSCADLRRSAVFQEAQGGVAGFLAPMGRGCP